MTPFIITERKIIFFLLCCGCVTISFNVAAIAAVVPVVSTELKVSDFLGAQLIPFYLVPYGLAAFVYAPLTRWFSYRRILGVTLACYALAGLLCGFGQTLTRVLIGRVAMGLTASAAIPLGLIVIGQIFPKHIRGRLVGVFFSCSFFSSIAGLAVSGFADWRWLFFIPAGIGLATAMGLLVWRSDLLARVHGMRVNYLRVLQEFRARNIFLFIFCLSFLYHGVHKWFGVYLSQIYGLDKLTISMFFIIMAMSAAAGQLVGGCISDKWGRGRAVWIGILILGLATALLSGHYPIIVLLVILSAVSLGWTVGHNGISTVLTDFPPAQRPAIASLNSGVRFLSGGLGFMVSRLFVEKSFSLTFFGIGVLFLFLLIPYMNRSR